MIQVIDIEATKIGNKGLCAMREKALEYEKEIIALSKSKIRNAEAIAKKKICLSSLRNLIRINEGLRRENAQS